MAANTRREPGTILRDLIGILEEMTRDWDSRYGGPIDESTYLVRDLGCESIDIVMLIVAIEQHFDRQGLPFQEVLIVGGEYVKDLKVADLVRFLERHLGA
jgi:acyl carrier protein